MRSKRRSRVEILHDMLQAIEEKGNKVLQTHIMYKANLSHNRLMEYLSFLLDKNFIEEDEGEEGNNLYSLTTKGKNFLEDYEAMKRFLESYGL